MKLSVIKEKAEKKAKSLGTYHIEDGQHKGVIQSVEYNQEKDRVYLKIELADGTIYKSSAELADYGIKPLFNIIEPFIDDDENIDFSEIKEYDITFTTKINESKDGNIFSNIIDFDYLYSDSEND